MNYFVLGGTGFVGLYLIKYLLDQGEGVTALVRDSSKIKIQSPDLALIQGDPLKPGEWQGIAQQSSVIINLVGSPIMTNWTDKAKKIILSSRIDSTSNVVSALKNSEPKTFICANAVGYYGPRGDELIDDHHGPGKDFLSEVAVKWQETAMAAEQSGHRVVVARFSAVLGPNGGALAQMVPIFRLGLGGRLGNGRQWFPWIHILDLARALHFVSEKNEIKGPVNMCSAHTVTNAHFTKELARALKRPALFLVPGFALKLMYGEVAEMLLTGQRCIPKVLRESGFEFKYEDLSTALADIAAKWYQSA